jgi:Leucine-rich repeat (LRR) protein
MLCTQLQALARHSVSVASISCSLQWQHDCEPEGQFRFLLGALDGQTSLLSLTVEHFSIEGAWSSLRPLTQLQRLNIRCCGLAELPQELSCLVALTSLDLACNVGLRDEWQHLLPLSQLRDLDLQWCHIELSGEAGVPEALSRLTALSSLRLGSSYFVAGWRHLLPLEQLRKLHLSWGMLPLAELPRELSVLTALTCLGLSGLGQLQGGWQHLEQMQQLKVLHLRSCHSTELPTGLSALTAVTPLDLACTDELHGGWQHLRWMQQLKRLSLSMCKLSEVPADTSKLTSLNHLDLAYNPQLQGGWQHLLPLLKNLRELSLHGCRLAAVPQELFPLQEKAQILIGGNCHLL